MQSTLTSFSVAALVLTPHWLLSISLFIAPQSVIHGPGASAPLGSLLEMQSLGSHQDLLSQSLNLTGSPGDLSARSSL